MSRNSAPTASEIEVSVFGRGFGESILLHIGDGRWVLIDCLRDAENNVAPYQYLKSIGAHPSEAIQLIVATHWHDDHVQGIAEAYKTAQNALLALPNSMERDELRALLMGPNRTSSSRFSSGVSELAKIAEIRDTENRPYFKLASANKSLLRYNQTDCSHGQPVSLEALSPADADVHAFIVQLTEEAERPSPNRRIMPFSKNHVSVALWLSIGVHKVLLGADLENSSNAQQGWNAVMNSTARNFGRAKVIKVPHHGSSNAHDQAVWDNLLEANPVAALTTWNRGQKLPKPSDVDRICGLAEDAYITSQLGRSTRRRLNQIERSIREAEITLTAIPNTVGHIQMRLELSDNQPTWTIELSNGAIPLSEINH